MKNWMLFAFGLSLVGCKKEEDPSKGGYLEETTGNTNETTGGGEEGGEGGGGCTIEVTSLTPESGESGVYYRSEIAAQFDDDVSGEALTITLSADGADVPVSHTLSDNGFDAIITPDSPLLANTTYTLSVSVCESQLQSQFTTSEYGGALDIAVEELAGRTYNFDLGGGEYVQPEGLGPVLGSFLSEPLLIGVGTTSGTSVAILGTQGIEDGSSVIPDPSFPIWDFGTAVLDGAYFISAETDIELEYGCATIPIYGFQLEGTFAADGTSIGGGRAIGLGDSRDMGCLMGLGSDPNAICATAAGFGLSCESCPDGNPWCLTIEGYFDPAPEIEGLSLAP